MFLERALVLVPALNEARSITQTIELWQRLGAARVRVIDNGSTDSTASSAAAAGAEVVREAKRGYGAAVWRGLQDWPSDCEWVLFSSADGSDRLTAEELHYWQDAVAARADLVIGDRTALASSRRHLKLTQRLGNWICVVAIAAGWGRRFRDMGSLRLVRREALERMQLKDRGFGWNVEMQVRALELGMKIVEVPVGYYPRHAGSSKISGSLRGTARAGCGILRMLFYLYRLKRAHQRTVAISGTLPA
jgi:glycosyltransferase involved in cell wall biosynthesis